MESLLKIVLQISDGLEYGMRSQVSSFLWCSTDSKYLPSKSCRKKISPVLMTEAFSEVLKIITFLQMIHVSLKMVGSTVEAKMSVCKLIICCVFKGLPGSGTTLNTYDLVVVSILYNYCTIPVLIHFKDTPDPELYTEMFVCQYCTKILMYRIYCQTLR